MGTVVVTCDSSPQKKHFVVLTAAAFPSILMCLIYLPPLLLSTPPLKADLVQLAPQLKVKARDICATELTLTQALCFNLFVPTASEFADSLLTRFAATMASSDSIFFGGAVASATAIFVSKEDQAAAVAAAAAAAALLPRDAAAMASPADRPTEPQAFDDFTRTASERFLRLLASNFIAATEIPQSGRGALAARAAIASWLLR